jgi:hypothetical protein
MTEVNIGTSFKSCDTCIVNTMCRKSCEKFQTELTILLKKKIPEKYIVCLSDDIRISCVENPKRKKISLYLGPRFLR